MSATSEGSAQWSFRLSRPLADIARLCRDYGVSELALFGSVARGEDGPDSDIDFLYVLSDPTIGIRFFEFHHRLAEMLGRDADEVNLVPKNYLHRMLRDPILAEAAYRFGHVVGERHGAAHPAQNGQRRLARARTPHLG